MNNLKEKDSKFDAVTLNKLANQLRLDSLEMIYRRQAGHPGGSFSAAEI